MQLTALLTEVNKRFVDSPFDKSEFDSILDKLEEQEVIMRATELVYLIT